VLVALVWSVEVTPWIRTAYRWAPHQTQRLHLSKLPLRRSGRRPTSAPGISARVTDPFSTDLRLARIVDKRPNDPGDAARKT